MPSHQVRRRPTQYSSLLLSWCRIKPWTREKITWSASPSAARSSDLDHRLFEKMEHMDQHVARSQEGQTVPWMTVVLVNFEPVMFLSSPEKGQSRVAIIKSSLSFTPALYRPLYRCPRRECNGSLGSSHQRAQPRKAYQVQSVPVVLSIFIQPDLSGSVYGDS